MSALRFALDHPANQSRQMRTVLRWSLHNLHRRVLPWQDVSVPFGLTSLVGPIGHPVVNLARYVNGGLYDYDAFRALMTLLGPGDTFIDVGASIGAYSLLAGSLVGPRGLVIAVEPAPEELPYLRINLGRVSSRTVVVTTALADLDRSVRLCGGSTLQHLEEAEGTTSFVTSTLDRVLSELDFDESRSFAKIDTEGWDSAVVAGGRAWLSKRPIGLLLEANDLECRSPIAWSELVTLVQHAGLRFVWPDFHERVLHEFEQPPARSPFQNYFAVSPEALTRLSQAVRSGEGTP
jgi:FkbM family methyltransferase